MKTLCTFDTSITSRNTGDHIIMNSVNSILQRIFKDDFQFSIPTHENMFISSHLLVRMCDIKIVGGSNLLSSNMPFYNQWKVNLLDTLFLKEVVLLGVGWWQYQNKPNFYTRILLKRILSKKYIHSVRDEYTKDMLNSIGIFNVINTSCPTMWNLTKIHCKKIPKNKSNSVVFTFTSYKKDITSDLKLINLLKNNYKKVYFWPQQPDDFDYFKTFNVKGVNILPANLIGLSAYLNDTKTDYIGTRLHAGIKALNHKKRTLILAVDNRAAEIKTDTNLPVIYRKNFRDIENWINSNEATSINIPTKKINKWINQFNS